MKTNHTYQEENILIEIIIYSLSGTYISAFSNKYTITILISSKIKKIIIFIPDISSL